MTEICKEMLCLNHQEFGRHLEYTFYCSLLDGHAGVHKCILRGWNETYHKRNQIVTVYWFERKDE